MGEGVAGDGLGGLPKWPVAAKELAESNPPEPPRARWQWALGLGVLGGAFGLFRGTGGDVASLAGSLFGGAVSLALVGLAIEAVAFDFGRRRRRREDR